MNVATGTSVAIITAGWIQLLLAFLFGLDVDFSFGYAVGVTASFIIACYVAED